MRAFSRLRWILCLVVLLMCGSYSSGRAQQFISGPSMGLDDVKSALRNPATISFHRPQVALGAKVHHLGIGSGSGAPLRQGFLAGSTPFLINDRIGIGGSIRYFDTPIFKKRAFGASVTGRLLRFLSVGARVTALNLSYNESEFVGIDPGNDPVFSGGTGKTTLTGTIGVFAKPIPNLNLAAGVRNLNRPSLTLGESGIRAHREFFGGVSYGFGPFRARAEVSNSRYGVDLRVALEAYTTDGSYLRIGSDATFSTGVVEGQLHVGGPLSVNYQYNLPTSDLRTATSGSHQFSVIYEFGRTPEVPKMPSPPSLMLEADRSKVEPSFEPKLYVASSHKAVQHLEKRIERKINVPDEVLKNVSREALGRLDSSFATSRGRTPGKRIQRVPENMKLSDVLSADYDSTFARLRQRLRQGDPGVIELLGRNAERVKAFGLYNRLRSEEGIQAGQIRVVSPSDSVNTRPLRAKRSIPSKERLSILNPEQNTFTLLFPYLENTSGIWRLTIENQAGKVVKAFGGSGQPRGQLEWNWSSNQGDPLDQGVYTYQFEWEGEETYQSNEGTLLVEKTVRKITIEVTRNPEALEESADALELRIKK